MGLKLWLLKKHFSRIFIWSNFLSKTFLWKIFLIKFFVHNFLDQFFAENFLGYVKFFWSSKISLTGKKFLQLGKFFWLWKNSFIKEFLYGEINFPWSRKFSIVREISTKNLFKETFYSLYNFPQKIWSKKFSKKNFPTKRKVL